MNQSDLKANACNRRIKVRENACERGTIGFGFGFHWLRKWCEFCQPITERKKKNRSKCVITFDTQLKTALEHSV